jgi:hypothetical protein
MAILSPKEKKTRRFSAGFHAAKWRVKSWFDKKKNAVFSELS